MKLKDFMNLHKKDFNYEILLRRIDENGEHIHLDYANDGDDLWEIYFKQFFDCEVESFGIELDNKKPVLVVYIKL